MIDLDRAPWLTAQYARNEGLYTRCYDTSSGPAKLLNATQFVRFWQLLFLVLCATFGKSNESRTLVCQGTFGHAVDAIQQIGCILDEATHVGSIRSTPSNASTKRFVLLLDESAELALLPRTAVPYTVAQHRTD